MPFGSITGNQYTPGRRQRLANQMTHQPFQPLTPIENAYGKAREHMQGSLGRFSWEDVKNIGNFPPIPEGQPAPGAFEAGGQELISTMFDTMNPVAAALTAGGKVVSKAAKIAALRAEANANRFGGGLLDTSYRGLHTAPAKEGLNSIDNLADIFPDDIYNPSVAGRYYGHGEPALDNKTARILAKLKGNPDAEVTIYRAVPKGTTDINPGDWVTINKDYAKMHGESWVDDDGIANIIETKVKASELMTDGNSIHEWGWQPK